MYFDRFLTQRASLGALPLALMLNLNACSEGESREPPVPPYADAEAVVPTPGTDASTSMPTPPSPADATLPDTTAASDATLHADAQPSTDAGSAEPDASAAIDAAQADASAAPDANEPCVRGQTKAERVLMIGDSFYDFTEVPERLWDNARSAGSLGANETYPHYYKNGALMNEIVAQYATARTEGVRADYVIMNGGGNEVLIADRSCLTEAPPKNAQCTQTIDKALAAAKQLFVTMQADGIKAVVFANYPHMPEFGLFQGSAPAINQTGDYAEALSRKQCEDAPLPCYFVSTIAAFEGHPEYLNFADVHASPAGSKVVADLIWSTMQQRCVAQ